MNAHLVRCSCRLPRRVIPRLDVLEDRCVPSTLLDPDTQPKFVNPLPIPGVMEPTEPGGTNYEVSISQFEQPLGLYDPETGDPLTTTVWGYNGTYPGASFEARQGTPINVLWTNDLVDSQGDPLPHLLPVDTSIHWAEPPNYPESGVPVVTHLHGGHSESASDGLPEAWFTHGFSYTGNDFVKQTYYYNNDQEAATLWYHDHALGITRLNVYAGLAGFYLLRDDWEDSLNLPKEDYEVPIVIQDRMFTDNGQLYYPSEPEEDGQPDPSILPEFFGDFILVNGSPWPFLEVEPRKYRFRLLNGSDSRFYTLSLSHGPQASQIGGLSPTGGPLTFFQIGSDGGLLEAPVPLKKLTLGPGERADVVMDFSHPSLWGKTILVRNNAKTPFPGGETIDTQTVGKIMVFRVTKPLNGTDTSDLPATLRPPITLPGPVNTTRQLLLFEGVDEYGRLRPQLGTATGGVLLWSDPYTENPNLNDVEVWEIFNASEDAHPIHLHLVQFQVFSRQKFEADVDPITGALSNIQLLGRPTDPNANEAGYKDTVQMFPGEVTRIIAKFDLPGLYVWHCHILSHEDHEMMRPYYVSETGSAPSVSRAAALVTAFTEAAVGAPATSDTQNGKSMAAARPVAVIDRSAKSVVDSVFDRGLPSTFSSPQSNRRVSDLVFAAFKQRPKDESFVMPWD